MFDGDCRAGRRPRRLALWAEIASHHVGSLALDPLVWIVAAAVLAAWGAGLLRGWTRGD